MLGRRERPSAARARTLRLLTLLSTAALVAYCTVSFDWSPEETEGTGRRVLSAPIRTAAGSRRSTLLNPSAAAAAADEAVLDTRGPRPIYVLSEDALESAVLSGSERHGEVRKAGPLPADFWTDEKRVWRETVLMNMAKRDMAQPHLPEYWVEDESGELTLRPLRLPFPSCHTYVNHKYKIIFIIHPKSASTATKRYLTLCRVNQTDSCLTPLEHEADLPQLRSMWKEYFVFTFVRNPWVRAFSSWKFLREGYMLPPGEGAKGGAPPCVEAGWRDFCGDPFLLGRMCLAMPHCCPGKEGAHFMFYHITDQATCLMTEHGDLAVDFIGRVESVDEDMQAAIEIINSRLPSGVEPLELPENVAARNIGPQSGGDKPPDNSRYLPAFQGSNHTCFSKLSRFYEKDVRLLYPSLYDTASRMAAAAASRALAR